MVGKTLGHYEILEPLGAGGMGEVYLGEDPRLGRKVAIKVLPEEYARDPERLARFEQEARAAAALNHPNIAVVHDIGFEPGKGDDAGTHFMVQEYLRGQSLKDRLDKGALPLDKALGLAIEVGEALTVAHRAGIVHRDLKPDNIFVTQEGHAKVLDFGLAKLTEAAAPSASSASMSPTLLGTVAGQVMGTAGYMAPEQVAGEEVDARADMFAFGAVLYEMVTRRRAFVGESVAQTLSKIAHEEPTPINDLVVSAPTELSRVVRKCLAKESGRRYQSAADLAVDLRQLQEDLVGGVASPPVAASRDDASRASMQRLATIVTVTAIVMLVAGYMAGRPMDAGTETAARGLVKTELYVGPAELRRSPLTSVAIVPNTDDIIFVGYDEGERRLFRRSLDADAWTPIAGTEGAAGPEVSPDGETLLFWADGALKTVPIGGGRARVVYDLSVEAIDRTPSAFTGTRLGRGAADVAYGATWENNDSIVYARFVGGLWRVPAAGGGQPEPVTQMDNLGSHRTPSALPNGNILYTVLASGGGVFAENTRVEVVTPDGTTHVVVEDGGSPRYVEPGVLLFARRGALMAVRFDPDNAVTIGEPTLLIDDVDHAVGGTNPSSASGAAQFAASSSPDMLVFLSGGVNPRCEIADLIWLAGGEEVEPITAGDRAYFTASLSPRGDRILSMATRGGLWIIDPENGDANLLTQNGFFGIWDHDGEAAIHGFSVDGGKMDIVRTPVDNPVSEPLVISSGTLWASSVSSDGRYLAYVETHETTGDDIWFLDRETGETTPIRATPASERYPKISPNGDWLAYVSDFDGEDRVYVEPFPGGGRPIAVSGGSGVGPSWLPTGNAISFRRNLNQVMIVDLEFAATGSVIPTLPPVEFSTAPHQYTTPVGWTDWDKSGGRALSTVCRDNAEASTYANGHIRLWQGWFSEFQRASGAGSSVGR